METGDTPFGNIYLVLTDPPYNVLSEEGKASIEHYVFTQEDIRNLVELCLDFMALKVYEHILCAWLQFGGWYQSPLGQTEEVPCNELVEGEEGVVQRPLFGVETDHCTTRKLEIILVILDRSRSVTSQCTRLWYIYGELLYGALTCWTL